MRLALISCVLILTIGTFFSASWTLPTASSGAGADPALAEANAAATGALAEETERHMARIAELEAQLDAQVETIDTVTAARNKLLNDLGLQAGTLVELRSANEALTEQVATLSADAEAVVTEDGNEAIAALNETIAQSNAEIEGLNAKIAEIEAVSAARAERIALLESDDPDAEAAANAAAEDQIASLTATVTEKDQIAADLASQIATYEDEIAVLRAQVDGLTEAAAVDAAPEPREAQAVAAGAESVDPAEERPVARSGYGPEAVAEAPEPEVAAEPETPEVVEAEVVAEEPAAAEVEVPVAETEEETVVEEEAETTEVAAAEPPAEEAVAEAEVAEAPTLAVCQERIDAVQQEAKINFATGTASIAGDSVPVVENLTGIVLECAQGELILEIGGHTDSQGGQDNNLALSERRAQAVYDALLAGEVPEASIRAVGYGEAQPIASNTTAAGRAENRRITFEWQSVPAAETDTTEQETE